ncbi:NAD kinase [uncultured archaeon]|nr:NAD kinase [uncultured archaeon]
MMKLSSAVVRSNPHKQKSIGIAEEVSRFLEARGIAVHPHAAKADMMVVVGGDGTILFEKEGANLPIFGIGGRYSQICQAKENDWEKKLVEIASKGFSIDSRSMLSCSIGGKETELALNDVVIRSRDYHMVRLVLAFGAEKHDFRADGLVISTPTGSTAYSYACGAPALPPHARKLAVAAVAPHMRAFKPRAVGDETVFSVAPANHSAQVVIDGQFAHSIGIGGKAVVRKAARAFPLVSLPH